MPSDRRTFLTAITAGSGILAGCTRLAGTPSPDEPPAAGVDELPEPGTHGYGATGSWSSFGCNAANTRAVADGHAPVDGVTERWRVETAQTTYHAPVVANGLVFLLEAHRTLRVLDAADGEELWTLEHVNAVPLVREDIVYVPVRNAIRALEVETGEVVWEREFERSGRVTSPSTYAGEELVCAVGEDVFALETEDGEVRWEREVFGDVLDHAPHLMGNGIVVATEAGRVYLLDEYGTGWWEWKLPSPPTCPPTVDTDTIYVTCQDWKTYALDGGPTPSSERRWTTDTGVASRGIAVASGLVFVANSGGLYAIDAGTGDQQWHYDIGDWSHLAPTYGRETVFVGGDRLRAFDPAPGGDPDDGPALRFEQEFAGRVGPGPVLDDGTLYVVAEADPGEYALLALE